MKSTDLMIGDWVFWVRNRIDTARVTGATVLLDSIFQNGISAFYNGSLIFIRKEDIEPIPLTAEILEKNGWKLMSNTCHKLEYSWSTGAIEEYADIHIYIGKDHSNVWRWDFPILNIHLYRGDIELTKFRYVHELQHALKLCGIEKEIKL